jgi:SagB-type dehydrogenase family enzyme
VSLPEFRRYHEATKHTPERLRSRPHTLDWANAPDPFRRYEGVSVFPLPANPPSLEAPAFDILRGCRGRVAITDGATLVSQILWHSAAISAARRAARTGERYFLRVNPSSGNLHPTEFHFATHGLAGWSDGLYHYRVLTHEAEQRATGDYVAALIQQTGANVLGSVPLVFVLTTIVWREAWKYRERAYRYCLLDMGHAWEALALAARAAGLEAKTLGHFPDDAVADLLRLEDEWPLLVVCLCGPAIPTERKAPTPGAWFGGVPSVISTRVVSYPEIEAVHGASKLAGNSGPIARAQAPQQGAGSLRLPPPARPTVPFGKVARQRRSALDFEAGASMKLEQLSTLLEVAFRPFHADFEGDLWEAPSSRYIQLYVFVHAVRNLAPGLYRYRPESGALELLRSGDQRLWAAALSLGQDLAGNACVAFSMVGDLERAFRVHGDRGYRYVHFEAGAIGQRLYLAAEALGLRSTGIGAFYDDAVHQYLDVPPSQGQVVYHFACGHAIPDAETVVLD